MVAMDGRDWHHRLGAVAGASPDAWRAHVSGALRGRKLHGRLSSEGFLSVGPPCELGLDWHSTGSTSEWEWKNGNTSKRHPNHLLIDPRVRLSVSPHGPGPARPTQRRAPPPTASLPPRPSGLIALERACPSIVI